MFGRPHYRPFRARENLRALEREAVAALKVRRLLSRAFMAKQGATFGPLWRPEGEIVGIRLRTVPNVHRIGGAP